MAKEYLLDAPFFTIGDPTVAGGAGMVDFGQVPSATVTLTPSKAYAADVGGHPQAAGAYDRGIMAEIGVELFDAQNLILHSLIGALSWKSFAITAVDTTAGTFGVDEDLTSRVESGDTIIVEGSTGNDGEYTVSSVSYTAPTTTITVNESVSDSTADGTLAVEGGSLDINTRFQDVPARTIALIPSDEKSGAITSDLVWWGVACDDQDLGDFVYADNEGEGATESYNVNFRCLRAETDQAGTALIDGQKKIFRGQPDSAYTWSLPSAYS